MQSVLVVDDDPEVRAALAGALEEEGLAVRTAANGVEALRCIAVEEPAVVLLDLQMPGMDGAALLDTLRTARLTTPVVLMSADTRCAAVVGRADAYLAKPFELNQLYDTVAQFTQQEA
jgi:CheY-like chemotaxis protein